MRRLDISARDDSVVCSYVKRYLCDEVQYLELPTRSIFHVSYTT
jgi:hypothetical protein